MVAALKSNLPEYRQHQSLFPLTDPSYFALNVCGDYQEIDIAIVLQGVSSTSFPPSQLPVCSLPILYLELQQVFLTENYVRWKFFVCAVIASTTVQVSFSAPKLRIDTLDDLFYAPVLSIFVFYGISRV